VLGAILVAFDRCIAVAPETGLPPERQLEELAA